MTYELAKKLKEAGFPQVFVKESFMVDGLPAPTPEELIEACGEVIVLIWGCKAHGYFTSSQPCNQEFDEVFNKNDLSINGSIVAEASGKTPSEAVANLWLALNEKWRKV